MFKWVKIHDGHDNFFTPLRLIFAYMVVVGHTFAVTAGHDPHAEPFIFFHYKPSYLAVNLFFIASGFLVTKSMLYRGDLPEFSSARILRIFPALAVHMLFVMFIMGPLATNLPLWDFFTHPQFYTQPLQVLTFYETNMVLPGAFVSMKEQIGSAPLWTLRYEVLAYIGTAILFAFGMMRKKWVFLAQFVICAMVWIVAQYTGIYDDILATFKSLIRFGIPYGLGAAIFAYKDRLKFNIWGVFGTGVFAALTSETPAFEVTTNIFLAYFIFWAAYIKLPKLTSLQKINDVSYGVYIYHWCILQLTFYYMPEIGTWATLAIVTTITLILAKLSWHFVEKPMLANKKAFAERLRFNKKKTKSVYDASTMLLD
ncbi:MAG: acyltransferase family protein [Maricaulaceae bacterium]